MTTFDIVAMMGVVVLVVFCWVLTRLDERRRRRGEEDFTRIATTLGFVRRLDEPFEDFRLRVEVSIRMPRVGFTKQRLEYLITEAMTAEGIGALEYRLMIEPQTGCCRVEIPEASESAKRAVFERLHPDVPLTVILDVE